MTLKGASLRRRSCDKLPFGVYHCTHSKVSDSTIPTLKKQMLDYRRFQILTNFPVPFFTESESNISLKLFSVF